VPNPLMQLMRKYQRGNRSTFHLGPILPIAGVRESGLSFNDVFRDAETMSAVARMSFELGFESTVLPFDLNVEAEILGARVLYHDGFEGHPVYPTIAHRPVVDAEDVAIPTDMGSSGRMPAILHAIRSLKNSGSGMGAVGAFIPGPFTLAGQVMEPEQLFIMLLKNPDRARRILERLTAFINALKTVYAAAGVDFMVVEEGGGGWHFSQDIRPIAAAESSSHFCGKTLPYGHFVYRRHGSIPGFSPGVRPGRHWHRSPVRYGWRKGKNPGRPAAFYGLWSP